MKKRGAFALAIYLLLAIYSLSLFAIETTLSIDDAVEISSSISPGLWLIALVPLVFKIIHFVSGISLFAVPCIIFDLFALGVAIITAYYTTYMLGQQSFLLYTLMLSMWPVLTLVSNVSSMRSRQ